MSHPEWALKNKKPGTELRLIHGHYYLYEVKSKWNPKKKRAQKITGKLLGKITKENGFVESSKGNSPKIKVLQAKEYGVINFITEHMMDSIQALEKYFPNYWRQIMASAMFRLLYQSPLKNMEFYLASSFLSELYPDISLSSKQMSELLRAIGNQRNNIVGFFSTFIEPNKHLLIDITNIHSKSRYLSIAKTGYNSQRDYDPQVNLLLIFSDMVSLPVYYRILPGNIRDVKAFKLSLKESGISDAVLVADKGFYSEKNLDHLDSSKLKYVLPLRRNNFLIDYSNLAKPSKIGMGGYFKYKERFIWYDGYRHESKRLFIFLTSSFINQCTYK